MCSYSTREEYRSSCGCTECKCKRKNRIEPSAQFLPYFNELISNNPPTIKKEEPMLDLNPVEVNRAGEIHRKLKKYFDQNFYLTGSQFFVGKGDDYDYFTRYTAEIEEKLRKNGFEFVDVSQYILNFMTYTAQDIVAVYRKDTGYGQIDIQLVKDPTRKVQIQEILGALFNDCGYVENKRDRARLWEFAYRMDAFQSRR